MLQGTSDQVKQLLKSVFISNEYSEKTWDTYTNVFISWMKFAELYDQICIDDISLTERSDNFATFTPQRSLTNDYELFLDILNGEDVDLGKYNKNLYDLSSIGLVRKYYGNKVELTERAKEIEILDEATRLKVFLQYAAIPAKVKMAIELIKNNTDIKKLELKKWISLNLDGLESEIYQKQVATKLYTWATFIIENIK